MEIEFESVAGFPRKDDRIRVPTAAVVAFEFQYFVCVRHDDWIKPVPVRIHSHDQDYVWLRDTLTVDAEVAINNAGLVRLAYIEAFGASGQGHGH
ncbi:MAG: hypothetical protein KDK27_08450 [Leptospiraceae bacterium]|nr:hypothetical protein [Leptospiraceae bacterium]